MADSFNKTDSEKVEILIEINLLPLEKLRILLKYARQLTTKNDKENE